MRAGGRGWTAACARVGERTREDQLEPRRGLRASCASAASAVTSGPGSRYTTSAARRITRETRPGRTTSGGGAEEASSASGSQPLGTRWASAPSVAEVVDERLGHGRDGVSRAHQPPLERTVGALLNPSGPRVAVQLEVPAVPHIGDPGASDTLKRAPDHVPRLGGQACDHAVEPLLALEAHGTGQGERRRCQCERLGDDDVGKQMRPVRVGVRLEDGTAAHGAAQAGPEQLQVVGERDPEVPVVGELLERGRVRTVTACPRRRRCSAIASGRWNTAPALGG